MGTEKPSGLRLRKTEEGGWECDHCKKAPGARAAKIEISRPDDHPIFEGRIVICPKCAGPLGKALQELSALYA